MPVILLWLAAAAAGADEEIVDFDTEVMPVLTRAGCNTGACHGAAVGRGGFRLSLYGGDPEFDYRSIVLELNGRRVNLSRPEASLILLKATESIRHGGGPRLEFEGAGARLLQTWIRQGSPRLKRRDLSRFTVSPRSQVVMKPGETVVLKATAEFSDGTHENVTQWTVFSAEDPAAVRIDSASSLATLSRRGRHIVVARYLDQVVPIELIVPLSETAIDLSSAERKNFVDDEVLQRLSTLRIPVSPQVDDATFLRRATLDLTGRLPAVKAVREFSSHAAGDRRAKLIDQLLASEEFNEFWTLKFARLLRIRSQPQDAQGALTWHRWLKTQLRDNVPYDSMARQMLVATGDSHQVGPASFYRTVSGAREQAEFVSELFMGSRLRCANCHNHPLDRWTQDDYHGLSAIFARLQRGRVIRVTDTGEVSHPRTGEAAVPRIPGERFLDTASDGRVAFAEWLTDSKNPYFARAIVNRLWKAMMGRGLVEPTDDFRDTNPATHPALLDKLATDFVENGYDLRHTLRRIALSSAYARSSVAQPDNRSDDRFYSRALTRPLEAEVLADAISDVTGLPETYGDVPSGTRAIALFDPKIPSPSLDILGRCSREESCESAAETAGGLTRKLHLFNGPLLNRRIADPNGRLARQIRSGTRPEKIIRDLYLRALSREPSLRERQFWTRQIRSTDDATQQKEILEDFLWGLLTCQEFVTNH